MLNFHGLESGGFKLFKLIIFVFVKMNLDPFNLLSPSLYILSARFLFFFMVIRVLSSDSALDFHGHRIYFPTGDVKSAVSCVENAVSIGRGDGGKWVPLPEKVTALMSHFEKQKDVEGAEGLLEIVKKSVDNVGVAALESLIRTYAVAGRTSSSMRRRLKMENVEVSEETKKLLDVICVE